MASIAQTDLLTGAETSLSRTARTERRLLFLAGLFIAVNFIALALQRPPSLQHWLPLIVWTGCAVGGSYVLQRYLPQRDPFIFPIVMLLSGWGLLLIDRLAPIFADRQGVWLLVSTLAMLATAIHPRILRWLRQYRYLILFIGLALLISTIILGRNPSGFGPALWLGIGQIYFQPSEVLKIILVAFLASYLSEQHPALRAEIKAEHHSTRWRSPRIIGPIILMWSICVIVLVWQRDLGTAILFFAVFLILLYVASGQPLIILAGIILTGLAAVAAYYLFDVVQLRIDIWLNPWPEADGRAYQIVQSLMAFAAGGVTGNGIGLGSPEYIPVVHSDFVFAALAEEWGFIGVMALIVLLALFVIRGLRVALLSQERPYRALLATGLSMLIAVQSLLIMGGVLKLIPLTGVTLPWLSYGGSSLLMTFILSGLLLRLSAEATS